MKHEGSNPIEFFIEVTQRVPSLDPISIIIEFF